MTIRSFLALHETTVSGQIILSCAGCAACLGVAERGEASDGETATVCAGAVVRNGRYCRGRCAPRWPRVVGDRDSCNADLEPRCGGCERVTPAGRAASGTPHRLPRRCLATPLRPLRSYPPPPRPPHPPSALSLRAPH